MKFIQEQVDSILFDLDGTLWDSREGVVESWNLILKQKRPDIEALTKQDLTRLMGLQLPEIGKQLFPDLEEKEREALLQECCVFENQYLENKGFTLYPQIEEGIKRLAKKYTLCIVSNCQEGYIETFFKATGLGKYFKDFENPGRTGLLKGENIRLVVERNQLKHPVYIGDTLGDFKAARQAGVPFIFASYGFGEVEEYEKRIKSFKDLLLQLDV